MLVLAALATGGCPRNEPPAEPPAHEAASHVLELRYAAVPLVQALELELTDTRVGQYVQATLTLEAVLEPVADGDDLRTRWSLERIDALELSGTVEPDELERARTLLLDHGRGTTVSDAQGIPDLAATDADASNAARDAALDGAPPSGVLLMTVLAEQLRLPRLTTKGLPLGEPVEHAEESETAIAGTDWVLPTTTVHRFTIRRIDDSGAARVAEVAILLASVAEPEEGTELDARLETRAEGTLLFDLDHGLPVSLELSRTDSFRVGETEGERSLVMRSTFRSR
ncbi:hypothetical protein OEB96_24165 [Paraliomyxa miuraensis]|nr:hypothetical protein [Paraliomyxa miuraensis]